MGGCFRVVWVVVEPPPQVAGQFVQRSVGGEYEEVGVAAWPPGVDVIPDADEVQPDGLAELAQDSVDVVIGIAIAHAAAKVSAVGGEEVGQASVGVGDRQNW